MNEEDYAIVIGVSYRGLPPLKATLADATRFMEWLRSPEGGNLPDKNIKAFLSPQPVPTDLDAGRPIGDDISRALTEIGVKWDSKRVGRRLYFYFTGHGLGPRFDDVAMLMGDSGFGRFERNIGLHPYRTRFYDQAPFDEVVIILDCCRDPERPPTAGPGPATNNNGPVREIQDFVVLAAPYGEKAFEAIDNDTGDRRGFLTKALLEGLTDPMRADAEGRFTSSSLREYLVRRVPQLALGIGEEQEPKFELPDDVIVFSEGTAPRVLVHIVAKAGLAGELVLRNGNDLREIERRPAADVTKKKPWIKKLVRNSRYELAHTGSGKTMIFDLSTAKEEPHVVQFK